MMPRVTIFSIDGLRPDALQRADTPTLDRLTAEGASTMTGRSVLPSVTLPCHTSIFRGVDVPRHGITDNVWHPLARPVPSVIDVAHAAGLRTGMFYNWGELRDLCDPSSLDVAYLHARSDVPEGDWVVAEAAARHAREGAFDLMFVYLGHTDQCGHDNGWMSEPYLKAIAHADRCVRHVLDACQAAGPHVAIVLSDHGGHERTHGTDSDEDMTVPWIANGEGVRKGWIIERQVRLFDTAPTVASLLGIELHGQWEGRAIDEIWDRG